VARLVVATGNAGKLEEFRELLASTDLALEAWAPDVAEDQDSYEGNAAVKATAVAQAHGVAALGDDSGVEVDALGGYPGLHSARIAATQAERNRLLLARLAGRPRPWTGRFVCVLALAVPGQPVRMFTGVRAGELTEPRGTDGFGYDPLFLIPELGVTFGELPAAEKHRWSHRGAAVRALLESGALHEL
jgi:XTP/dITP diphosphohydrolase